MAKTKVSEFDAVASNNTDINNVNVSEGCPPSGINDALRSLASLLKKQEVGTDAMTSPDINGGTIDGATIGGSSGVTIGVSDGTVSAPSIKFTSDTNTGIYRGGTDILKFVTAGTDAVTIDASQNVGIGTTTPNTTNLNSGTTSGIVVKSGGVAKNNFVALPSTGGSQWDVRESGGSGGEFTMRMFDTSGTQNVQISSNGNHFFNGGNVGIGNSSPTNKLEISANATNNGMLINNTSTGNPARITLTNDEGSGYIDQNNNLLRFNQSGSTDVVIDSIGNLLVGKTATDAGASAGFEFNPNGYAFCTRASAEPLIVNRTTTDGRLIQFRKDNSNVGSIGTFGSALYISSPDGTDAGLRVGNSTVVPVTTTGALRSSAIDLGSVSARWKDLYLSGGAYIGGTGSANYLDDYEEGTFTPTLTFGGGSVGITYLNQTGKYTKIGNTVSISITIILSNKGSSTGTALITGLPFAVTQEPAYSVYVQSVSFADMLVLNSDAGTNVNLREVSNAGITTLLNDTNFANDSMVRVSGTYILT